MFFGLFGKNKEEEIKAYAKKLSDAALEDDLDGGVLEDLIDFSKEKDLGNKDLARAQSMALETVFEELYHEGTLSDDEYDLFKDTIEVCYMLKEEDKYKFETIAKRCNALYKVTELSLLPKINKEFADLDYKEGEDLHFVSGGKNFISEGTPSLDEGVRIQKGNPWKKGDLSLKVPGKEDGKGAFRLTTLRIDFKGKKESFTVLLKDLDFCQVVGRVVFLKTKDGKVHAVALDDTELFSAVLSNLLNRA